MKKTICIGIIISLLFYNCTEQFMIKDNETFEQYCYNVTSKCEDEVVEICLKNNIILLGENLIITPDSTIWNEVDGSAKTKIATSDLKHISYQDNTNGTTQGFLIGASVAFIVALITLGIIGLSNGKTSSESTGFYWLGSVLSSVPGAISGGIYGGINGSKIIFEF